MKRGQIWVETVIYTLIAFSMIGLALGFVKPKIEELQDKGIIEQSLTLLEDINEIIETLGNSGNQRLIEVSINKGDLKIDCENDRFIFEIDSRYQYSEFGQNIESGNVLVHTEKINDIYRVNMTLSYENYNLTYDNSEQIKILSKSPTSYRILISNRGEDISGETILNIEII